MHIIISWKDVGMGWVLFEFSSICTCGQMDLCSCSLKKKLQECEFRSKLMQFLMGLNDAYEGVGNHILFMEPLQNVNRAFYIVQQVEK